MSHDLLSLPDEILLNIATRLVNLQQPAAYTFRSRKAWEERQVIAEGDTNYYRDLHSISLTCKRLSLIARELLLNESIFVPYTKVDRLLECFIRYPQFAQRTKSLDVVRGHLEYPYEMNIPHGRPRFNTEFIEGCKRLITNLSIKQKYKDEWTRSLFKYCGLGTFIGDKVFSKYNEQAPYFGLLLAILPKLKRLHLGTLYTDDIPVLDELIWNFQADVGPYRERERYPPHHKVYPHQEMLLGMLFIAPRLTHLELPLNGSAVHIEGWRKSAPNQINILKSFTNLHTLTLPPFTFSHFRLPSGPHPSFILPPKVRFINVVGESSRQIEKGATTLGRILKEQENRLTCIGMYHLYKYSERRKRGELHYLR